MFQYMICMHIGKHEGSSLASLNLFCFFEEHKTATEVAEFFKKAFQQYAVEVNEENKKYKQEPMSNDQIFEQLFKMECHETCGEFDILEECGFDLNPSEGYPISKIVFLDDMQDFVLEEPESWYYTNMVDGEMSAEIFNVFNNEVTQNER